MPKSELPFDPSEYATVAERVALFYERFPRGRIITDLVSRTAEEALCVAYIYRASDDRRPSATGWSLERVADGGVNRTACVENAETSAVGRALANLGFTASKRRPSREEMEKALRVRRSSERPRYEPLQDRQQVADETLDLIALVRTAERYGMRPARAERLRARALDGAFDPFARVRLAQLLRRWIARRFPEQVMPPSAPTTSTDS
ncbi:MAG: hypothetical protein ACT4PJ_16685 [Gemmatimonadaceae bacterium]